MFEENGLSIVVILTYVIFFFIMFLFALIPSVINAIGLARICNKLGAFRPVWSWVWALVVPSVAVLRVGDMCAEREYPYSRKLFRYGILAMIVFTVLATLTTLCSVVFALSSELVLHDILETFSLIGTFVLFIPTMLAAIWMAVPLYISYFRIFKAYMPVWGAWLTLIGMLLFSQLAFLVLPVLSFLPMRDD